MANIDIDIKDEAAVLDALSSLSTSAQNLANSYSSMSTILGSVENSWDTDEMGSDSETYRTSLKKNISTMNDTVIPQLKSFNKVAYELIEEYRASQQ